MKNTSRKSSGLPAGANKYCDVAWFYFQCDKMEEVVCRAVRQERRVEDYKQEALDSVDYGEGRGRVKEYPAVGGVLIYYAAEE